MAEKTDRGNPVYYDSTRKTWRYIDDGLPVDQYWKMKSCGKCGEYRSILGHDPCIANLPGVRNACCGHGIESDAYVIFEDDRRLKGADAIAFFEKHSTKDTCPLTSIFKEELDALLKIAASATNLSIRVAEFAEVTRNMDERLNSGNGQWDSPLS